MFILFLGVVLVVFVIFEDFTNYEMSRNYKDSFELWRLFYNLVLYLRDWRVHILVSGRSDIMLPVPSLENPDAPGHHVASTEFRKREDQ